MAVMSELLQRKCNAAIPLVDVGTDVFAFRDDREEVARLQVKTAKGIPYRRKSGYTADFRIPIAQLERTDSPELFYVLAVRLQVGWGGMLVIGRAKMQELRNNGVGSEVENAKTKKLDLKLWIKFHIEGDTLKTACGDTDFTEYLGAWSKLPPLKEPPPID